MPTPTGLPEFQVHKSPGAEVVRFDNGLWRLSLLPGKSDTYHCAQIDDYKHLNRSDFPWSPGCSLSLEARVSCEDLCGTWGFGFWNDPFQVRFGIRGGAFAGRRLPVLPNASWFFFAAPPNYLAFRDDHPSQGFLASVFSSPLIPSWILGAGVPFLPLLGLPVTARFMRRFISSLIKENAQVLPLVVTKWNHYKVICKCDMVEYLVNDELLWKVPLVPKGKLGLVIWIDNQYAAFPPNGKLKTGLSEVNQDHWLEIKEIKVEKTNQP